MARNIADAAIWEDWDEVRLLVERGGEPNAYGGLRRETGLHYAARYANKAICELLLKRGANSNAKTGDGCSPLHYVCSADVCKLLVAHRADITAVDNFGSTPLMEAVDRFKVPSISMCDASIDNK
jgi:ankyrin repeat protein